MNQYNGLNALLTPDNCVLLMIDHQPLQLATIQSMSTIELLSNAIALAKSARVFGVPTVLTTVLRDRGGQLVKGIQDVFPDQEPIDRTWINTWEDKGVVDAIKNIGRKKIVMAGLWTEVCLAFPAIQALGAGFEVYAVTDASGGVSKEAHDRAITRIVQAGAVPITWLAWLAELQRDWAREKHLAGVGEIFAAHGGAMGSSLAWEFQLLGVKG